MIAVAVEVDLYLPGLRSLKDKRKLVKSIVDGIAPRYRAAVAEVGHNEDYQRATVGFAFVGASPSEVHQRKLKLLDKIRGKPGIEIVATRDSEWSPTDDSAGFPGI